MPEPRADLPEMEIKPTTTNLHEWSAARDLFGGGQAYFLTMVRPGGCPHVMPVWGVWLDDAFYFSTSETSRKGRNLAANPACAIAIARDGFDLVLEGHASMIDDESLLQRVVDVYTAKYDWPLVVRDGRVYLESGDSGAFYVLRPGVAFSFIEEGGFGATRYRF